MNKNHEGWFNGKVNSEIEMRKLAIGDLYYRMATSNDQSYREDCLKKCNKYLAEMEEFIQSSLTQE